MVCSLPNCTVFTNPGDISVLVLVLQAWPVLTAALLKPPLTVLQLSAGVPYVGAGQQHPGAEDRTVTASAALQVIHWDLPLPVAVGEPVGEPVQRLWKLAGNE